MNSELREFFSLFSFIRLKMLRPYQKQASDAAVKFMLGNTKGNGIIIAPTGSGKSWLIADIANRIGKPVLVFCPSKEIVEQNYEKMQKVNPYGCSCYSASVGMKEINKITFATIGSVMNHLEDFDCFQYIMIDECHCVNSKGGQYEKFIHKVPRKVIGLTATPFRLSSNMVGMSMLKFLTRTRPRIFSNVICCLQVSDLLCKGYLARLSYYDITPLHLENVQSNSTGADFNDKSLIQEYERSGFYDKLTVATLRVLNPKSGIPRKGVLVFTRYIKEADELVQKLRVKGIAASIVTGETPKTERENVLAKFKSGEIKVVANVGCLTTGFDYPELDTIILARPTKSLSLYYQMIGRAIRPCSGKEGWIVDMSGSYKRFGKVEDLKIQTIDNKWSVVSRGRQLTNVLFS